MGLGRSPGRCRGEALPPALCAPLLERRPRPLPTPAGHPSSHHVMRSKQKLQSLRRKAHECHALLGWAGHCHQIGGPLSALDTAPVAVCYVLSSHLNNAHCWSPSANAHFSTSVSEGRNRYIVKDIFIMKRVNILLKLEMNFSDHTFPSCYRCTWVLRIRLQAPSVLSSHSVCPAKEKAVTVGSALY